MGARRAVPPFEPAAPFAKGQRAEILGAFAQDVVEPHTGGIVAQHLLVRRFAIEALLELIERRDLAARMTKSSPSSVTSSGIAATISGNAPPISSPERE